MAETMIERPRVKPLGWPNEIRLGQRVTSQDGLIQYTICHYGGSEPESGVVYRWAAEGEAWRGPFFSYEGAISEAQADYERRILSALIAQPDAGRRALSEGGE